jgi:PAS domain S-box-containing protein
MDLSRETRFELLKAWYLATLRKRAVDAPAKITPGTLIHSDRAQIEEVVLSGAQKNVPLATFRAGTYGRAMILSLLMAAVSPMLALAYPGSSIFFCSIGTVAAIGALILSRTNMMQALERIGSSLAKRSRKDIAGYHSLPAAVQELVSRTEELESGERLIVEQTSDILLCFDEEFRLEAVNASMAAICEYLPEELIGSIFTSFIFDEDIARFRTATTNAKTGNPVVDLELRVKTKSKRAADVSLSLDWSASNSLYFVCGEDVSSEKRFARAKAEYVSTIGHDIRIPLTAVLTSLESLSREQLSVTERNDILVRLENNVERLIALVDELLEYERSASSHSKLPLRYSNVLITELMLDAVEDVASLAQSKQIEIKCDVPDLIIEVDRDKLFRVAMNLLSNAIKYSPAGTAVDIRGLVINEMLEVRIIDRGPGIPDIYRSLIFERYERVPTTAHVEGTGLGLSICKAIINSHGGSIGVNTGACGGSEFWFNIPISPA